MTQKLLLYTAITLGIFFKFVLYAGVLACILLLGFGFAQRAQAQEIYSPYGPVVDPMAGPQVYPYGYHQNYPAERPLPRKGYDSYYERGQAYVYGHPDDGAPSQAPMIPIPRGSFDY